MSKDKNISSYGRGYKEGLTLGLRCYDDLLTEITLTFEAAGFMSDGEPILTLDDMRAYLKTLYRVRDLSCLQEPALSYTFIDERVSQHASLLSLHGLTITPDERIMLVVLYRRMFSEYFGSSAPMLFYPGYSMSLISDPSDRRSFNPMCFMFNSLYDASADKGSPYYSYLYDALTAVTGSAPPVDRLNAHLRAARVIENLWLTPSITKPSLGDPPSVSSKKTDKRFRRKVLIVSVCCIAALALSFSLLLHFHLLPLSWASGFSTKYASSITTPTPRPTHTTQSKPSPTPAPTPAPRPANSRHYIIPSYDRVAPLSVSAPVNEDCYVYLSSNKVSSKDLSFYVRANNTVKTDVPLGSFTLYYATGSDWYGINQPDNMVFGDDTKWFKADTELNFTVDSEHYNGYSITLYTVIDGNLDTEEVDPEDLPF